MGATFTAFMKDAGMVIAGAVGMIFYKIAESIVSIGKKIFFNMICSRVEIQSENNAKFCEILIVLL